MTSIGTCNYVHKITCVKLVYVNYGRTFGYFSIS